jgi:S-DNA-T family DNA segregation ATPase FtsK/SpoIIIE
MTQPKSSKSVFNRPPRIKPAIPRADVRLPTPPGANKDRNPTNWITMAMPVISVLIMVGAMAALNQGRNAVVFAVPMTAMAIMGVATTLVTGRTQRKQQQQEFDERVTFYEEQLAERSDDLRAIHHTEHTTRLYLNPGAADLWQIAGPSGANDEPSARLWERRLLDEDFLELRVGLGQLPLSSSIDVPQPQGNSPIDRRLFDLRRQYQTLRGVPMTVHLASAASLGIAGPPEATGGLLRSMLWHMLVLHAPTELRIALVASAATHSQWEWLRWAPHTVPMSNDTAASARMVAHDPEAVNTLMSNLLDVLSRRRDMVEKSKDTSAGAALVFPHLCVIIDDNDQVRGQPVVSEIISHGPLFNMSVIFRLAAWQDIPSACRVMLDILPDGGRLAYAANAWSTDGLTLDQADAKRSDELARHLANIQLADTGGNQDIPRSVRLFDMLNIQNERDLMPPPYWAHDPVGAWHADVPIGKKSGDKPLFIDLYENKHGPHGIIAGATGAGKSVLLQCMIAALVIKHSPIRLQLLLIDFKGGASLAMFEPLPHTVVFVTDLEGRLAERAMTAIKSEIRYRKTILRHAAVQNITEYREKAAQEQLKPLANLIIVIDEFDEMAKFYAEFVTELVRVVKQGRSLGVHLLLATQQPSKAVTDEIRTQLKFFIALRLGSSEDSREMILKPDAAFLPTDIPGRAYFRVGAEMELFQVAQITSEYHQSGQAQAVLPAVKLRSQGTEKAPRPAAPKEKKETDLDVLVRALAAVGDSMLIAENLRSGWERRPIWQPPLPARLTLAEEAAMTVDSIPRLWQTQPSGNQWLTAVIGRLDIPQMSHQEPLALCLPDGHVAITGAPSSGKTTLLRTLILSLATTHGADDVWFYAVDAGGQGLSTLSQLPHVGSIIQVRDRARIRRLLTMLGAEINRRQELFRHSGVNDLSSYRHETGDTLPAIVTIIDKIAMLREEFGENHLDSIVDELVRLVRIGRSYGIYFVITADQTRDYSYRLLSLLEQRVALRLPDLYDYSEFLGSRVTMQIPPTIPGRALINHPDYAILDTQIALPTLDPPDPESLDDDSVEQASIMDSELNTDLKEQVASIRAQWLSQPGRGVAQAIELLPDQLSMATIDPAWLARQPLGASLLVPIGREELTLNVVALPLSLQTPHVLLLGGRRSGKTTTIRTMALALAHRYSADELKFVFIEINRRNLRPLEALPHTVRYANNEADIKELVPFLQQWNLNNPARLVIFIDDFNLGRDALADQFSNSYSEPNNLFAFLGGAATNGADRGIHLVVSTYMQYSESGGVIKTLEDSLNGLILAPTKYDSTKLMGVNLPLKRDSDQPTGRSLMVQYEGNITIQTAYIPDTQLQEWIDRVAQAAPTLEVPA